jgi:hypothetical protein
MAYDSEPYWDGVWRDLHTGVDVATMDDMSPAFDQPGIPLDRPIDTRLEGPAAIPWWDGLEDPFNYVDFLPESPNPLPWCPSEGTYATGARPRLGAYEGGVRTRGAVQAWSSEVGGGLWADQWTNRIMRFPANIPERYDPYGVYNTDIRDDLAASLANGDQVYQTDTTVTTGLLQWPNVWGRWG